MINEFTLYYNALRVVCLIQTFALSINHLMEGTTPNDIRYQVLNK